MIKYNAFLTYNDLASLTHYQKGMVKCSSWGKQRRDYEKDRNPVLAHRYIDLSLQFHVQSWPYNLTAGTS